MILLLGWVDNFLSNALDEILMSGNFWGDHSNVVPIVPGQHDDDGDDDYDDDDDDGDGDDEDDGVNWDDDDEDLTRMENIADIWCSMLGASWSWAIEGRPSRDVL